MNIHVTSLHISRCFECGIDAIKPVRLAPGRKIGDIPHYRHAFPISSLPLVDLDDFAIVDSLKISGPTLRCGFDNAKIIVMIIGFDMAETPMCDWNMASIWVPIHWLIQPCMDDGMRKRIGLITTTRCRKL